MLRNAFILSDTSNPQYRLEYYHNPQRWRSNVLPDDSPIRNIMNWSEEIKYYNADGVHASTEIDNLPDNTGGVYVFYIKGHNLTFFENYILYIGRCKSTSSQNIRKRALEYLKDSRETIKSMMTVWKADLYYRYFPDTDNDRIDRAEALLIRAIVPFYNEKIPDSISVQPTINAF